LGSNDLTILKTLLTNDVYILVSMGIDLEWAVLVSITGIALTIALLAIINTKFKHSNQKNVIY